MDPRVRSALLSKIDEAIQGAREIREIQRRLGIPVQSPRDFAFGIAIGRIYNSFHYQTRRVLGRNATDQEFSEFLGILEVRMADIKRAYQ